MFERRPCGVVAGMNARALHEPDTDSPAEPPASGESSEATKGTLAGVVTPARMGLGGVVAAVVVLVVVLLVGRSRRRSRLKDTVVDTVLHLPAQVDSLVRRGVEHLSHVTG